MVFTGAVCAILRTHALTRTLLPTLIEISTGHAVSTIASTIPFHENLPMEQFGVLYLNSGIQLHLRAGGWESLEFASGLYFLSHLQALFLSLLPQSHFENFIHFKSSFFVCLFV